MRQGEDTRGENPCLIEVNESLVIVLNRDVIFVHASLSLSPHSAAKNKDYKCCCWDIFLKGGRTSVLSIGSVDLCGVDL